MKFNISFSTSKSLSNDIVVILHFIAIQYSFISLNLYHRRIEIVCSILEYKH